MRDDKRAKRVARARLEELGIILNDDERPVRLLSGGQRQSVAIARIAGGGVKVAILDEPTAALGVRQTKNVLELVRSLARRGTGVIMITHDIDDVFAVADRVVVLRLGRVVHEGPAKRPHAAGAHPPDGGPDRDPDPGRHGRRGRGRRPDRDAGRGRLTGALGFGLLQGRGCDQG